MPASGSNARELRQCATGEKAAKFEAFGSQACVAERAGSHNCPLLASCPSLPKVPNLRPAHSHSVALLLCAALYAEEDAIGLSRGYKAEASVRREAELATV